MIVSEILQLKGSTLYTATPETKLAEAVATMAERDIGSLVVGDALIGRVMDDAPLTCTPNTDVNEVRRMMLERHARYLPVLDGKVLTGVISFFDVAKAVFEAQNFENQMLKAYIRDWPAEAT
jgi:CBS domain-containing protein